MKRLTAQHTALVTWTVTCGLAVVTLGIGRVL